MHYRNGYLESKIDGFEHKDPVTGGEYTMNVLQIHNLTCQNIYSRVAVYAYYHPVNLPRLCDFYSWRVRMIRALKSESL